MSDLLADAREIIADISSRRPGRTHYEGCRTEHIECLLADLIEEAERLRLAIRRLADHDATLSVCDGAVTVTLDATLTDAEREAVETCIADDESATAYTRADTLRGLLERLG